MLSEKEFLTLVSRVEDETLDFKSESYDLSSDDGKYAFIKDVICMANTPRSDSSFIVMGVKKHSDGRTDLNGITKHLDDADLQAQFTERIYPIPRFSYQVLTYQDKQFGIVAVPPDRSGPHLPLKDRGGVLRQHQVYFRRGSRNDVATSEDLRRIISWINSPMNPEANEGYSATPAWDRFMDAVHGFESMRRYVLFSNVPTPAIDGVESVGLVNWCFVADFDPDTERNGLLKALRSTVEEHRTLHLVIGNDRPTLHLDRGTYWFLARGLNSSRWKPEVGPWKVWQRRYGNEMKEQITRLAKASIPSPVTIVALWYQNTLNEHLQSAFETALAAFDTTVDFLIVTADPANLHAVAAKFDAALIDMPLGHFSSGIANVLPSRPTAESNEVFLPSSSGTPVPVGLKERNWIEEEMELVHLGVGASPTEGQNIGMEFLTGHEISWYDLGLHYDVERDRSIKLEEIVRSDLKSRRCTRVNLFHNPGAGGTTVGRRIAWNLHTLYPSAILRQTKPSETVDKLQHLVALTGQPLLLLAEGSDIAEAGLDEIFQYCKARHLPVVILQVLRRFSVQTQRERSLVISGELSIGECNRFVEVLSRVATSRRGELERLAIQEPQRLRTPFHFCLKAFGKDFLGIESYVQIRLGSLNDVQRRIVCSSALSRNDPPMLAKNDPPRI